MGPVEASALRAPALARRPLAVPLLRLRSDDQLIALFRAGSEEAFSVIHDRYRQRLFAYVRQMLSTGPRADAEDVLQDVFVRAYGALRNDDRPVNLPAWLYRVAHNRCIDQLRRPAPPAEEVFQMSRTPLQDPIETAQRRDDLKRLVEDVGRLPEQQRSALLMREIDGMAYADIAEALEVTVPAVKSLLVRARVGLVEAIQARDTDCAVIRGDLVDAYDRGVKASGRARKHMRECAGCRDYRTTLRGMRRSFAALSPAAGFGPLALVAKTLGLGGAGGGGAAAGAGALSGTAAACKVAAVVCGAALATGGAVEVKQHLAKPHTPAPRHRPVVTGPAPTRHQVSPVVAQAVAPAVTPAAEEPALPLPVDAALTEPPVVVADPSATPVPTATPDPAPAPVDTATSDQPTTVSAPSEPAPEAAESAAGEPSPAPTAAPTQ
jgi:RNA polymerase sigma factor (sigma-70 family)